MATIIGFMVEYIEKFIWPIVYLKQSSLLHTGEIYEKILSSLGIKTKDYSSHNFRIGMATKEAKKGCAILALLSLYPV